MKMVRALAPLQRLFVHTAFLCRRVFAPDNASQLGQPLGSHLSPHRKADSQAPPTKTLIQPFIIQTTMHTKIPIAYHVYSLVGQSYDRKPSLCIAHTTPSPSCFFT